MLKRAPVRRVVVPVYSPDAVCGAANHSPAPPVEAVATLPPGVNGAPPAGEQALPPSVVRDARGVGELPVVRVEPEEGAVGVIHGGVKRLSEYPVVDGNYLVRGCVGWGRCGCGDGGGGPCGASECAAPREAAPEGYVGHVDSCMYLRECECMRCE